MWLMPLSFSDSALENFTPTSPLDPAQPRKDEAQCSVERIQETRQPGENSFASLPAGAERGALPATPPLTACGQVLDTVSLSDLLWEMGTMPGLSSPGCPWLGLTERGSVSTWSPHPAHGSCSVNGGYYQPVLKNLRSFGA